MGGREGRGGGRRREGWEGRRAGRGEGRDGRGLRNHPALSGSRRSSLLANAECELYPKPYKLHPLWQSGNEAEAYTDECLGHAGRPPFRALHVNSRHRPPLHRGPIVTLGTDRGPFCRGPYRLLRSRAGGVEDRFYWPFPARRERNRVA